MDYRGIRYTLRAGIERGQWSVVIYPQGVETSGVKVLGTRDHAELHARRMIKRWLKSKSQQGEKSHRVMNPDPKDSSEDQYGRQDSRPYSGWSSANCRNRNRPWHRRPCLSAKVLARGKRQSVLVADHKASVEFFNRPRWWEAAGGSMTVPY